MGSVEGGVEGDRFRSGGGVCGGGVASTFDPQSLNTLVIQATKLNMLSQKNTWSFRQAPRRAMSTTGVGSQPGTSQPPRQGFFTGLPLRGSAPPSLAPGAEHLPPQPSVQGPGSASQHQRQMSGTGPFVRPLSRSGQVRS